LPLPEPHALHDHVPAAAAAHALNLDVADLLARLTAE
jgi:hypothetical protein